jgi:uncharacterized protein (DUF1330 family)
MPKAYWIAHVEVKDPDPYSTYVKGATAAFGKYGGRPLARGGKIHGLEGNTRPRNVIIEFESIEAALRCYRSPEYQEAKAHRNGHSVGDLMILEGIE